MQAAPREKQASDRRQKLQYQRRGDEMTQGWVKLHRSITENWLWTRKPFSEGQAWVDLLLMANHAEKKVRIGSELITLAPGTVMTSTRQLMERWGWGNTKVQNFIKALENDNMVSKRTSQKQTALIIENYTIYQEVQDTDKTLTRHSQDTDKTHNKNVKNVKNDNNNNIYISFKPPTVEEVRAYCTERNNTVNAETFVSFYESKGWYVGKNKMKDWKAAVRTWEKNNRQPTEKKAREEWKWLND